MLDYLIIFMFGIYCGTNYDCKPVVYYVSSLFESIVEKKKDKTLDLKDTDHNVLLSHYNNEKNSNMEEVTEDKKNEHREIKKDKSDNKNKTSVLNKKSSYFWIF